MIIAPQNLTAKPQAAAAPAAHRGWRALRLVLLALVILIPFPSNAASVSKEYKLKAAFIYKFTKFVAEWPTNRLAVKDSPITIGIFGENPFGEELSAVVQGRNANGRPFTVKRVASLTDAKSADVLFVARGQETLLLTQLPALHAAGVLTIGESEAFGALGGIINFTIEPNATTREDNIRFKINLTEAEKSGFKFSSQLLKVAQIVRDKT